jgi:hypothetical protein
MSMSSHIGPIVMGIYMQEEKVIPEELGGAQVPSSEDPNFSLEQGKLQCI